RSKLAAHGTSSRTSLADRLLVELFPLARAVEVRGDRSIDEHDDETRDREKERRGARRGRANVEAAQERRGGVAQERAEPGDKVEPRDRTIVSGYVDVFGKRSKDRDAQYDGHGMSEPIGHNNKAARVALAPRKPGHQVS